MLQPKRTKYRRPQKGRCKGNAMRGNQLAFGSFGIKSLETHWITARQIEAARVAMTRYMQRVTEIAWTCTWWHFEHVTLDFFSNCVPLPGLYTSSFYLPSRLYR